MTDLVERLDALADRLEQEGHFEIYRGGGDDMRTSAKVWLREDERDIIVETLRHRTNTATALEAKDKEIEALRERVSEQTRLLQNDHDLRRADISRIQTLDARLKSAQARAETAERERDQARAALKCEPTTAMIDAGVAFALSVSLSGEYRWSQYVADLYKTMRAAAARAIMED